MTTKSRKNEDTKRNLTENKEQSVEIPASLTFAPFAPVILSEAKNLPRALKGMLCSLLFDLLS